MATAESLPPPPAPVPLPRARAPLALKIGAASFGAVALTLALVLFVEYRDQRATIEANIGQRLQAVATTTALFLDADCYQRIQSKADADGPDYLAVQLPLKLVQQENGLEPYDILTLRHTDSGYAFVIDLRDTPIVGEAYDPPLAVARVLDAVQAHASPGRTTVYRDRFGTFVSAFAPIVARPGAADRAVVGIVEVDNDVAILLARLRSQLLRQAAIAGGALLVALALAWLVARSTTGPIAELVRALRRIQAGQYDTPIAITTHDEVGVLAQALREMLLVLRERLALLRFVPGHTRAVIARAVRARAEGGAEFAVERHEAAIFFSDIRGFTELSNALPPDRVMAMLNLYLRKEAEILERHGGSIDKFIGDAVMAVFEGPQRFQAAVAAAQEIQAAMAELNRQQVFERPIEVGIGIAGGEVVMGGIGYERRMEFAVIGRLVNLAARLTSLAGRGEILISDRVFEALGDAVHCEPVLALKLKGFAEPQPAYRLSGPASEPLGGSPVVAGGLTGA